MPSLPGFEGVLPSFPGWLGTGGCDLTGGFSLGLVAGDKDHEIIGVEVFAERFVDFVERKRPVTLVHRSIPLGIQTVFRAGP